MVIDRPGDQPLTKLSGQAFWLIPDEKSSVWFKGAINRLSKKFGRPPFEPHITLGSHKGEIEDLDLNLLNRKIGSTEPFSVATGKILCNDAPYQKITVSLSSSNAIHVLASTLNATFGSKTEKQEFHVSLLYGRVPCEGLQEDLRNLTAQLPTFLNVNQLWLVSLNGEPKDWKLQHKLFFLPDSQE